MNRLINFSQTKDVEWATHKFQIDNKIGMYKVILIPDDNTYELVRIIDGRGISVAHIAVSNSREELFILAERNLLNYIRTTVDISTNTMAMINLVVLLDTADVLESLNSSDFYDAIRIRDKAICFIRLACRIEFLYKGLFMGLVEAVRHKSRLAGIRREVNLALHLFIRNRVITKQNSDMIIKFFDIKETISND